VSASTSDSRARKAGSADRGGDPGRGYPFTEFEPKWYERWEASGLFRCDTDSDRTKYYCLNMYPYPSGDLHVGHGRNYILGDVVVRRKIMEGHEVLAPMG
jgi:leucyl-tRNA synthetase